MSFEDFTLPSMSIFRDDLGLEFEFCRVVEPGASPNAPADHLFSNGRLVPHDFPCSPPNTFNSLSRSVSQSSSSFGSNSGSESFSSSFKSLSQSGSQRSSSFGSNNGFELFSSSGSNSCSSSQRSSSSISSGRTSISDATPDRTELIKAITAKRTPEPYKGRKHVPAPDYGSRKWQFIAPAPVLNGNVLRRSGKVSPRQNAEVAEHQKVLKTKKEGKSNGRWRRYFCLFVLLTCNEFHAIEPSTGDY